MNEFYIGTFRKACDFCDIPFDGVSNRTEIIKKALDSLSEKERAFIETIYPIYSADNFAGTERRNVIRASEEFGRSKEEARRFKDTIHRNLLFRIEKLLKGEEIS